MFRLSLFLSSFLALLAFLAMPQTTVASRSLSAPSMLSVSVLALSSMVARADDEIVDDDDDDDEIVDDDGYTDGEDDEDDDDDDDDDDLKEEL
eukprot:CAMPEP_0172393684 /NCGR_PEP_ID=MMETSP1061-20121228/11521_1 /TAXON_ID=37318 /ORGANISM="Pseudo-nitzschia pungens, Strain cf. pungens" /LENGTH=92 /DNA_ID=CAMNT_0013124839 /DNA_START=106 /DNA_END=384 /DNA_ORIENTATION=+